MKQNTTEKLKTFYFSAKSSLSEEFRGHTVKPGVHFRPKGIKNTYILKCEILKSAYGLF